MAALVLFTAPLTMPICAQTAQHTTVSFDAITFDLPGPEWQRTGASQRQIHYTRKTEGGKGQSISVWPVTFPAALHGRSQQEHASAYFDIERTKERYEGRWEGFVEGVREIAGRRFATMSFTVTLAEQRFVTDGVFLLYFPDDFDQRRKFFTFMWMDGHPQGQPGMGLDVLDAIVASARIN
jgi:hypothetical protein